MLLEGRSPSKRLIHNPPQKAHSYCGPLKSHASAKGFLEECGQPENGKAAVHDSTEPRGRNWIALGRE